MLARRLPQTGELPPQQHAELALEQLAAACPAAEKTSALTDKDIVAHLFEFASGLDLQTPWPPGHCHEKGVLEAVLEKWKLENGGSQPNQALILFKPGTQPDWSSHDVCGLLPQIENVKTHVLNKPSGMSGPIPDSLQMNWEWTFAQNWSAKGAKLIDKTGRSREVCTFSSDGAPSNLEWGEFAESEAGALCTVPQEPKVSVKEGLAQH